MKFKHALLLSLISVCCLSAASVKQYSNTLFSVSNDSWQTTLNITSGSGYLDQVNVARQSDVANSIDFTSLDVQIRITVDGIADTFDDADAALGEEGGTQDSFSLDGGGTRIRKRTLHLNTRFSSSLKVEIKHDEGSSLDMYVLIQYREE